MTDTRGFDDDMLNTLATRIHQNNVSKGFWPNGVAARNVGEAIALIHSELSEAYEALVNNSMDDKLPLVKGFAVELADAMIRICDLCAANGHTFSKKSANYEDWLYPLGSTRYVSPVNFAREILYLHYMTSLALEAHRKPDKAQYDWKRQLEFVFWRAFKIITVAGYSPWAVIDKKIAYNEARPFMHGKNY